jgi:uncharacterized glyoxalase superfamily protein PhnB
MKPNIVPTLFYQNSAAAGEWLCRAFGFQSQPQTRQNDKTSILLRWGAGVVAIQAVEAQDRQLTYVRVSDIERHHSAARDAGANIVVPLHKTSGGHEGYSVRDMDGHLWSFGTDQMSAEDGEVAFVPEHRYRDLGASIRWLKQAFGFEPTLEVPGPAGETIHAELRLGSGTVFLSQLPSQRDAWSDLHEFINVVVADPDAHCARATAAGAQIVVPVRDTPFGARCYAVRDPEGFLWWVSNYTPAVPGSKPLHSA